LIHLQLVHLLSHNLLVVVENFLVFIILISLRTSLSMFDINSFYFNCSLQHNDILSFLESLLSHEYILERLDFCIKWMVFQIRIFNRVKSRTECKIWLFCLFLLLIECEFWLFCLFLLLIASFVN
jgi:hypothetical protein